MTTILASSFPSMETRILTTCATRCMARPEDEKPHAADFVLTVVQVSSALAACGLLNWVAT